MKLVLNYIAEVALFIMYFLVRVADVFKFTTVIPSYEHWRNIRTTSRDMLFPLLFWIFMFTWLFFSIWWSFGIIGGLLIIGLVVSSIKAVIDIYKGIKRSRK